MPAAHPDILFAPYLTRWQLRPDGPAIHTHSSDLLPVLDGAGRAAMLKVARVTEEMVGHQMMVWYAGGGAARVLAQQGEAIVLERLQAEPSLVALAYGGLAPAGQEREALRVLCQTVSRLHQPRPTPAPELPTPKLPTLRHWFRSLEAASHRGGLLRVAWDTAQTLLATPQEVRPLHGDIHHGNVLLGEGGEWRAIDPKGILGERGYDYANMLCNPDVVWAAQPERLERGVALVAQESGLTRERLLAWLLAYSGLSAAWWLEDGEEAQARQTLDFAARVQGL